MSFVRKHLSETAEIATKLDDKQIESLVDLIIEVRNTGGRIFFLGVGGSAANCSHAVNDFRKIVGIEAYAPTDNASELTARTNDDGWTTVFTEWLRVSHLSPNDMVFVLSVGGGNLENNISTNIVTALEMAKSKGARICGIVGRDGGFTARIADACVIVPIVSLDSVTPHTESFQAVIWHLLVSHPKLKQQQTKWESTVH